MRQPDPLLRAVLDDPDDDAPRLVYADWLDDHGAHDRAEFIRVQIELARLPQGDPGRPALQVREGALLAPNREAWVAALPAWARRQGVFRRGFVAQVSATVVQWLQGGAAVVRHTPLEA